MLLCTFHCFICLLQRWLITPHRVQCTSIGIIKITIIIKYLFHIFNGRWTMGTLMFLLLWMSHTLAFARQPLRIMPSMDLTVSSSKETCPPNRSGRNHLSSPECCWSSIPFGTNGSVPGWREAPRRSNSYPLEAGSMLSLRIHGP